MSELNNINFKDMDIAKLREYAKHLRLPAVKTWTKEDYIKAIDSKLNGRAMPELANSFTSVPPGYAKITIHEDANPGAQNYPVYLNANGYVCTVPRGVEVIVPMRVVRTLNDAKVNKRKQQIVTDNSGREVFKETTVQALSYPFTVHEMTPGPEVLTAHEKGKARQAKLRTKYRDLFMHWPRGGDLARAIEKGLITMDDGDELNPHEQAQLDKLQTE